MPLMRNKQEAQTSIDVRQWHVLYTRHQHEKPVARILSSKGHEVFLPLYAVTHRWQDRTKQLCLPLFPCYVFIRGGMDSQLLERPRKLIVPIETMNWTESLP